MKVKVKVKGDESDQGEYVCGENLRNENSGIAIVDRQQRDYSQKTCTKQRKNREEEQKYFSLTDEGKKAVVDGEDIREYYQVTIGLEQAKANAMVNCRVYTVLRTVEMAVKKGEGR
ncbi:hypothetical protein TWF106_001616 [Orbilia oligospora]|uniref:Uncharacterized protein n=1 Tax=Orbilia oligospora TaxID=2813651 RepID=A0A7C8QAY4_ORBOL|nr:hypothetical protein TWF106_001616 [Orbilia oligospora]